MERGTEETVMNLMRNISFPIKLGWAAVKNRDMKDRGSQSLQDGMASEKEFFKSIYPWNELDAADLGYNFLS
jgi:hypothetical protein